MGFENWTELRLSKPLLKALSDLKFDHPTATQRETIPAGLLGRDVLGTAETGSGKTAAFLLPVLERLWQSPSIHSRKESPNGPVGGRVATRVLILLPTRELAAQCQDMLRAFAKYLPVTHALVTGGMNAAAQESALRHQPDIVIATPGRVLDLLVNSKSVHIEYLEVVILDEADRLLEMGFKDECLEVLKHCARKHQTMLFSATLSEDVVDLADLTLSQPVRITTYPSAKVSQSLSQEFVQLPSEDCREATLMHLCKDVYTDRVIVFFQTKRSAHRMALIFSFLGFSFSELHGNLPQADRLAALQKFENGECSFLLATELASRGLDIAEVQTVINFAPPQDVVRYVHRVGRTARMGSVGKAVTLFTQQERLQVKHIARAASGAEAKTDAKNIKTLFQSRTVNRPSVEFWSSKIQMIEDKVQKRLTEERAERELRIADMQIRRTQNLIDHKDEIERRPERKWFLNQREKQDIREAAKAQIVENKLGDQAVMERRWVGGSCDPPIMARPKRKAEVESTEELEEKTMGGRQKKKNLSKDEKKAERKLMADQKKAETRNSEAILQRILSRRSKRELKPKRLRISNEAEEEESEGTRTAAHEQRRKGRKRAEPRKSRNQKVDDGKKKEARNEWNANQRNTKKRRTKKGGSNFKSKKKHKRRN